MSALATIVGSRVRAGIFGLLFGGPAEELHVREIQRRTGFNDRGIRQELAKLARMGLVTPRRDGNRLYYSACKEHPLYGDIRSIAVKTVGIVPVLADALASDKVKLAFIFGSVARGAENAGSDVDLLVVGSLGLRELTGLLSGVNERIGREINPHVFTETEFRRRLHERDHFLSSVLREKKLFVKGDERDLGKLAA